MSEKVNIEKNLAGVEDLTFGVDVEQQSRNGETVPVTQINAANMPFDLSRSLQEAFDEDHPNMEVVGEDLRRDVVGDPLYDDANPSNVNTCADNIDDITNANDRAWDAEANARTADSYSNEAEDVPVNIWASNGDGTYTSTPTSPAEFSAFHWKEKARQLGEANTVTGFSNVLMDEALKIGNPAHVDDLRKVVNHMYSAGVTHGCACTANGVDATKVDVAAGVAMIRATADGHSDLFSAEIVATTTVAVTTNSVAYLCLVHDGVDTVTVELKTNPADINQQSVVAFMRVVNENDVLDFLDIREQNVDHIAKDQIVQFYSTPFLRKYGSMVGSPSGLTLTVTAGAFFFQKIAHDMPIHLTTDTFEYYYLLNGAWAETDELTFDNTQYNDISVLGSEVLAALAPNKYKIDWIYAIPGDNPHHAVVYGQDVFNTQAAAEASSPPSKLPISCETGILIGRVIVQQGDADASDIESAFTTQFSSAQATSHEALGDLLGGGVNDHQHLTSDELTKVQNDVSQVGTTVMDNGAVALTTEATAEDVTTTTAVYATTDFVYDTSTGILYDCILINTIGILLTNVTYFTPVTTNAINLTAVDAKYLKGKDANGFIHDIETVTASIPQTVFSGATNGLKWVYKILGGSYDYEDLKPSYGLYDKESADDNRIVINSDGLLYNTVGDELLVEGNFSANVTGWTVWNATFTWDSAGVGLYTDGGAADNIGAVMTGLVAGDTYSLISSTALTFYVEDGDTTGAAYSTNALEDTLTTELTTVSFVARATTMTLKVKSTNATALPISSISLFKKQATLEDTPTVGNWSFIENPFMVASETPQYQDMNQSLSKNVMEDLVTLGDIETKGKFVGKNACTAWVVFDGRDGSILASHNVIDVIRTAVGYYTIVFETDMDDINYAVSGSAEVVTLVLESSTAKSVGSVDVYYTKHDGVISDRTLNSLIVVGGKN